MLAPALSFALLVTDYFPMKPGTTWEYNVVVDASAIRAKQEVRVLEPVEVSGSKAFPFQVYLDGKSDSTSYYRLAEGFVKLVAVNSTNALPSPIPILPAEPRAGNKWTFEGQTIVFGSAAPSTMKFKVIGIVKTDVLGKQVDAVKVECESKVGNDKVALPIKTTEYYAPGMGLVYRRQEFTTKAGGGATTTLVRFEEGRG
jgi:hypothetical protein